MRWKGRIPAGTTCPHIAGNIDLLPTFAKLVGTPLPSDRVIDGRDITSLMFHAEASPVRDTHLHFTRGGMLGAIRQGDWKLVLKAALGGANRQQADPNAVELYNLAKDPAETQDVSAEHPEIVARLRAELQRHDEEIKKNRRPPGRVDVSA